MTGAWFTGPVQDAISLVAQRNCVFLVYIHDDSEKTNTLNATLDEPHVIETINQHAVALSLEKSSENAVLFGQFYPIQTVPIIYFIKQGTIRDFGIETITSEEIVEKIIQVSEVGSQPIAVSEAVTPSEPIYVPSSASIASDSTAFAEMPSTATTLETASNETVKSSAVSSSTNTDDIKAKKAELQKQLEIVRKERSEREKLEAKEREIKRRQEAKLMQEAKQSRVDKENKIYFDKIKKERLQDEAHRKKVREQIAKDRAEKIAQRSSERQRSVTEIPIQQNINQSSSSTNEYSNLNIRQLDGTNLRNKFQASTTLLNVRDWINQNRTDDSKRQFKLSSQFPTRSFTEQDDNTTLAELNLCPSATIIMKPITKNSISSIKTNQEGMIKHVFTTFDIVYGFFLALINMLTGMFTSLFTTHAPREQQQQQQQQPIVRSLRGGQRLGGESIVDKAESSSTSDSSIKKRNPYATRVNTLQEDEDEDEKRSTYNGNSVNHE